MDQALYSLSHRSIWWTVSRSTLISACDGSVLPLDEQPVGGSCGRRSRYLRTASAALYRELKAQKSTVTFSKNHCDVSETTVIVQGRRTSRLGDGLAAASLHR